MFENKVWASKSVHFLRIRAFVKVYRFAYAHIIFCMFVLSGNFCGHPVEQFSVLFHVKNKFCIGYRKLNKNLIAICFRYLVYNHIMTMVTRKTPNLDQIITATEQALTPK